MPISKSHWVRTIHPRQVTSLSQGNTEDKQLYTHKLSHSLPRGNNLTWTWSTQRRSPMLAEKEHANSMQKQSRLGFKPNTLLLQLGMQRYENVSQY